ncbi:hypothetical protein [Chromobacterium subtsugae]|uniref:hypothetical protein n=1 Tax=Chromobacterium subtsugae TaxID=251747 RepID=UPI00064140C5|nr:hypothetical protein [Chromobacterium subtsugae]
MPQDASKPRNAPLCLGCQHYFITYRPGFPYGCRAMGFASKRAPCVDVQEASGHPCIRFQPKAGKPG